MSIFNQVYKNNKNIQNGDIDPLIKKALKYIKPKSQGIDLGCGQGRNTFYLAGKNFKMTAVDSSNIAIQQIKREIFKKDIRSIKAEQADISDYGIRSNYYNFVVCLNLLQFLDKERIVKLIKQVKNKIRENGIVIISSFTDKDPSFGVKKSSIKYHFKQGELMNMFKDFECFYYSEDIIVDNGHPGKEEKHFHGIVEMIARKG